MSRIRWWASQAWRYGPILIFKAVESLTVLGIFLLTGYVAWWMVLGNVADPRYARTMALVHTMSENWRAFLLLGVPLFYRPVRTFMEEAQEWAGMKRRTLPAEPPVQRENPPLPDLIR
jgi:hypothetical protein